MHTDIAPAMNTTALRQELRSFDIAVPPRTAGRTTHHAERRAICRLLSTLDRHGRLLFPVSLVHRDKPDFLLTQGSSQAGVEVTEAIPEQFAAFAARAERAFPEACLPHGFFHQDYPQRSKQEERAILEKGGISGRPWFGDEPEREWALQVDGALRAKLEKLKGYTFFDETWLYIYDNFPLPAVKIRDAAQRFASEANDVWNQSPSFQRIYVESGCFMIELRRDGVVFLDLEPCGEP